MIAEEREKGENIAATNLQAAGRGSVVSQVRARARASE